jgi:hypothetical protein
VSGEYILSTFENTPEWSGDPYDVVTAFDVFEHFLDAATATRNILGFLKPHGYLIIETGDWRTAQDLNRWYYCNLFEHQIFWSQDSIEYWAATVGLKLVRYERVNHKGRRNASLMKRAAIQGFRAAGVVLSPITGIDARLVPPPRLRDHMFAVLQS